jgi:hypothetical protein
MANARSSCDVVAALTGTVVKQAACLLICRAVANELARSKRERGKMMRRASVVVAVILAALALSGAPAQAQEELAVAGCGFPGLSPLVGIRRYPSNELVSAEVSWSGDNYGLLRERDAVSPGGPWEQFDIICIQAPDVYAIWSRANRRYVSAEVSWSGDNYGLLRARATTVGPWEQFRIARGIDAQGPITIWSVANGRYVSAEMAWSGDRSGLLRARATSAGPWEQFSIQW